MFADGQNVDALHGVWRAFSDNRQQQRRVQQAHDCDYRATFFVVSCGGMQQQQPYLMA